jgi:hypothetical protein
MMAHADYSDRLSVGCVCAEKMADDYVNPRRRERVLRNTAAKRVRDKKRDQAKKEENRQKILNAVWRTSKNGNPYLCVYLNYKSVNRKIHAVVMKSKLVDSWTFSVNGVFSSYKYASADAAKAAAKQEILRKFV